METTENDFPIENPTPVAAHHHFGNNQIKEYLLEVSKWGKFLAIVGYVSIGIMILLSIFIMIGFSALNQISEQVIPMQFLGIIYILFAAIYFFPINYLYRFSTQMRQALFTANETTLTNSFMNLKSLFKFMGIITVILLSLYALVLLAAVPMAIFMR